MKDQYNEHMDYLNTKIKPILEPMIQEIHKNKPKDINMFIINWLEKERIKIDINNSDISDGNGIPNPLNNFE